MQMNKIEVFVSVRKVSEGAGTRFRKLGSPKHECELLLTAFIAMPNKMTRDAVVKQCEMLRSGSHSCFVIRILIQVFPIGDIA